MQGKYPGYSEDKDISGIETHSEVVALESLVNLLWYTTETQLSFSVTDS